jgi:phage terminase large subunit-like protein
MKRKPISQRHGNLSAAERERRRREENPLYVLGSPLRPESLPKPIRLWWNKCEAKLLKKGFLAETDGEALLKMAQAAADGDNAEAMRIFKEFEARGPVPKPEETTEEKVPVVAIAVEPLNIALTARAYADDVLSGKIVACELVKKACRRFLSDLENVSFIFDEAAAQHVGDYIARLGLCLLPWQAFILANLFGFKKPNGLRRFQLAHCEVSKKNGKSSMLAAIGLYLTDPDGDGEPNAETYVAATTRFQSQDIVFKIALRFRAQSEDLSSRSEAFKSAIQFGDSTFMPLAANPEKLQGKNMSGGILDELQNHPSPDLYHTFTTSTASRKQPLIFSIGTAGNQREGNVAWGVRQHALGVLDGTADDPSLFAYIATLDEGDKWNDERVWIKANPSLGVLVMTDNLRQMAERAKALPSGKQAFCQYNVNVWPKTSYTAWLDPADFEKLGVAYVLESERKLPITERLAAVEKRLDGRTCFVGIDIGPVNDLSVLCMLFPPDGSSVDERTGEKFVRDGVFECVFRVWCPEDDITKRSKEHRVPYETWRDAGLIIATPGDTTDMNFVERDIVALRQRFWSESISFDIAHMRDTAGRLEQGHGIPMVQVSQGFQLSPAILRVEKLIKEQRLALHGHPVAQWCLANVILNAGVRDFRIDKSKSREKVDAASALCTAVDGWLVSEQTKLRSDGNISVF